MEFTLDSCYIVSAHTDEYFHLHVQSIYSLPATQTFCKLAIKPEGICVSRTDISLKNAVFWGVAPCRCGRLNRRSIVRNRTHVRTQFLLRMTDTMTSQNIDLTFWGTLYTSPVSVQTLQSRSCLAYVNYGLRNNRRVV
jgi:hypothetical protein